MILSLFFTRGVSLKLWVDQGLFSREKLIYEKYLEEKKIDKVYWFTYGSEDKKIAEKLKENNRLHNNIEIYAMPRIFNLPKIGSYLYSFFLPLYYKNSIKESDIFKTNQMDGAWTVVIANLLYGKIFIARTGYTLSQLEYSKNKNSLRFKLYSYVEKIVYRKCNVAVVASEHNKNYLLKNKYLIADKIYIIKNFIDIEKFKQLYLKRYNDRILFVGRLNEEKNLYSLINAVKRTGFTLDIYGSGSLESDLKKIVQDDNLSVNFMGTVSNDDLVKVYNSYQYYVLPSLFEGMPKTLLEAMACGCVCIGTNVSGINEVIEDQVDGLLCNGVTEYELFEVLSNLENKNTDVLSFNAIKKIESVYSLSRIAKLEFELMSRL
jgi:glycosyltransferase involved in cell wall biosynthesis